MWDLRSHFLELHITECAILCIICEDYDKSMFSAFFERPCLYFSMAIREGLALRRTIALFLFYFLSLSFFCSSSLFASFLPSAALSSAISVMNVLCVSEMEKLGDSKQQVVDNVREDETILHFQKSVQIPLFHFPQKLSSVVFHRTQKLSAKTWKTSCLEWCMSWNSIRKYGYVGTKAKCDFSGNVLFF